MKHLLIVPICLLWITRTIAGGGPETTLLVVNADSPLSLTVANHWMELHPIPKRHVIWLNDIPSLGSISIDQFRKKILEPIFDFMRQENIDDLVDTIVYSADFPYVIGFREDLERNGIRGNRYTGYSASITGLTFFADQVMEKKIGYLSASANRYFRREISSPSVSRHSLDKQDTKALKKGKKHLHDKDYKAAKKILSNLVEHHPDHLHSRLLYARSLAGLGETSAALHQLQKLADLGFNNSLTLRNQREFKLLRDQAGFKKIMHQIEQTTFNFEAPQGFSRSYHWSRTAFPSGQLSFDRYYLSASLAYTGQRGNSLPEILNYLKRSKEANASHPRGTVYLMENANIRSETRQPWFRETCRLLRSIGHACNILSTGRDNEDGILPKNRKDIIGLVAGYRTFQWKRSRSQLLKGAIAESFTSYGGDFYNPSQTKLTEFLRQGASGSSGAVVEPYAFPEKFPLPLMHYYYALGYTLAEAWYQSTASPYQTILVGDPLTRPFGDPIDFKLSGPAPGNEWAGEVELKFSSRQSSRIDHFEIWLDGRLLATLKPGTVHRLDTRTLPDGFHELHLVATEKPPRGQRTTISRLIRINNLGLHVTLEAREKNVSFGTPFLLNGTAPANSHIDITQGSRTLISLQTDRKGRWDAILPSTLLGMGPITIQAVAGTDDGKSFSKPLRLTVHETTRQHRSIPKPRGKTGFQTEMYWQDKEGNIKQERKTLKWINGKQERLLKKNLKLLAATISGAFLAEKEGFYQLSIYTRGSFKIRIDGKTFTDEAPQSEYGMLFIPLFLEKGWHAIDIQPSPEGFGRLRITLSGQETPALLGGRRARTFE